MSDKLHTLFESGVMEYFGEFGHRQARELPHQTWLLISVARYIKPQFVVAELTLPNQDIGPFGDLAASSGALNFDFAITRSEIDLRTWKARTPGWKTGTPTFPQTLETLGEVAVLAEFKIANSSSTSTASLTKDLKKLSAIIRFLEHHNCKTIPACYLVVLDPDRTLNIEQAINSADRNRPKGAPFPKILLGP